MQPPPGALLQLGLDLASMGTGSSWVGGGTALYIPGLETFFLIVKLTGNHFEGGSTNSPVPLEKPAVVSPIVRVS